MRAFFGVPFPDLPQVAALAGELAASGADLKVVPANQVHLTLKFLGEVPEPFAQRFLALLHKETLPAPFDVTVQGVGAFPSWGRFSVLWAGIEDPGKGLATFAAAAERVWVALGGDPERRPFRAHLTLARRRSDARARDALDVLERHRGRTFGTVRVDHANLYRSTLTAEGAIHDVVGEVRL